MTDKNPGTEHTDKDEHPAKNAPKDQGEIPRKRDDSKDDVEDPFDANKD